VNPTRTAMRRTSAICHLGSMTYFDTADNSCPEKGPSAGANWGQLGVIEHVYVGIHSLQIPIAENCSRR
jgi:hypothetical protein